MMLVVGGLVAQSCPTLATPWTVAHQAPLSMGFSTQGFWSGLPFSSPGDPPNPGIEPRFPALQAASSPSVPPGKPDEWDSLIYIPHSLKNRWTHAIVSLFVVKISIWIPASRAAPSNVTDKCYCLYLCFSWFHNETETLWEQDSHLIYFCLF